MSVEQNQTLIRRGYQALNEKDWATFDELCAPDIVFHSASMTMQGLEAYKQFLVMWTTAFPDLQFTVEDIISEADAAAVRHTVRGTHQGKLMGIPPTGKSVTSTGMIICHTANGKLVEEWFNGDELGILQQLGAIPAPGQAT